MKKVILFLLGGEGTLKRVKRNFIYTFPIIAIGWLIACFQVVFLKDDIYVNGNAVPESERMIESRVLFVLSMVAVVVSFYLLKKHRKRIRKENNVDDRN